MLSENDFMSVCKLVQGKLEKNVPMYNLGERDPDLPPRPPPPEWKYTCEVEHNGSSIILNYNEKEDSLTISSIHLPMSPGSVFWHEKSPRAKEFNVKLDKPKVVEIKEKGEFVEPELKELEGKEAEGVKVMKVYGRTYEDGINIHGDNNQGCQFTVWSPPREKTPQLSIECGKKRFYSEMKSP